MVYLVSFIFVFAVVAALYVSRKKKGNVITKSKGSGSSRKPKDNYWPEENDG